MLLYFSTELLSKFQELIYGQSSLRFSPARLINLEMQIRERVLYLGLGSFEDYYHKLNRDVDEMLALIDKLTTKETYFFRLLPQFKVLENTIIPRIEGRLSNDARTLMANLPADGKSIKLPLRIWSAGCATGEEAYSIAMSVTNALQFKRAWQVEVMASDISREAILWAEAGKYDAAQLDRIPQLYRDAFVIRTNGTGTFAGELRKKISFKIFNLNNLTDASGAQYKFIGSDGSREMVDLFERYDIIFCRNVMIYFDFAAQHRLIDRLYANLKPGGYLFMGDAELLHIYKHNFETIEKDGAIIYRKPDNEKSQTGENL